MDNGEYNTNLILARPNFAENYKSFALFKAKYVDVKPGGLNWYVPAFKEFKELYKVIFNLDDLTNITLDTPIDDWVANGPGASPKKTWTADDKSKLLARLTKFNSDCKTKVGNYEGLGMGYWCSTEGDLVQGEPTSKAVFISIGGYNLQSKDKTGTTKQHIRPIAKFGY